MSSWKLTAPAPTTVFRASSGQERRQFRGFVRVAVDTLAPRSIKLRKLLLRYVSKVHLVHLYICVCFMGKCEKVAGRGKRTGTKCPGRLDEAKRRQDLLLKFIAPAHVQTRGIHVPFLRIIVGGRALVGPFSPFCRLPLRDDVPALLWEDIR